MLRMRSGARRKAMRCGGRPSVAEHDRTCTPRCRSAALWSRMSDTKGDTTMAIQAISGCARCMASGGIWKHSDLPDPVAATITPSRCPSTASMIRRWCSRSAGCLNTVCATNSASASVAVRPMCASTPFARNLYDRENRKVE